MKCELCDKELKDVKGLSVHLVKNHNFSVEDKKNYYNKYLKKGNEGTCYFCVNESKFIDLTRGYHRICDSIECLGKTRATSTYEFLMYKYNLSKEDAIKLMNIRAIDRGEKIKESMDKKLKENSNFHKEKSHQSKEYWIKRGFSENEAIEKSNKIMSDIHIKTSEKRKINPEKYKDVNPTQNEYWIKKGYSEAEAKEKVSERQKTFTIEKCIEKFGIIEGIVIWHKRQKSWSDKMKNTLIVQGNYKKDSSKIEKELVDRVIEKGNFINGDYYCYNNQQFFIYNKDDKTYTTYDFVLKDKKKVIEFNGDYWHCNPNKYKSDFFNKRKQMHACEIWNYDLYKINNARKLGYDVLVIWESDYKKDKEATIEKCINFLNS